jgi:hypothetical protein
MGVVVPNSPDNESAHSSIETSCTSIETEEKEALAIQSPFQYEEKNNRMYFSDFKLLEKVCQ